MALCGSEGCWVVCLEQDARAASLVQGARHARSPLALILGEERHGIRRPILNTADEIWEIPRVGQKESLNVAVAAGIALWAVQTLAPPGHANSQT
ncbi:MAG: hypothetical protein KatS3mg100_012 [Candidatus Parcubacteria bacterium]|nr:MAG: hypothetical protein KatS3mg100_012 [Candidatus Parcubacteria bacterium]